ncbi:PIR protein, putative [Plasmodium sp. gorilla clade G1]|nr:PIR protein, putative [Plasmodium sp. gorilla clade G1]
MKLDYSKILLLSLPLNILVSSSYANNKNKPYIKSHTAITTSRVLSECDLYVSNYDNDPDMKSVKENFDRQTSQRFEEYDERMFKNRQKCKEQCDKDIQQIILKDKMEKSLEEKIEKGCLKCGCGLGGVALSVGIFGALAVNELTKAATAVAVQKGIDEGIKVAIFELNDIFGLESLLGAEKVLQIITPSNFNNPTLLGQLVQRTYNTMCLTTEESYTNNLLCFLKSSLKTEVKVTTFIAQNARNAAIKAGAKTTELTPGYITEEVGKVTSTAAIISNPIVIAFIVIVIVVIILIVIYLILRYRRKKKMNKKLQYTKLLNQ